MNQGKIDPRVERKYNLLDASEQERIQILQKIWREKKGTTLDLAHPKYFTEKLQWYKLNYYTPEMSRCVDKVFFKSYIAEKIGEGFTAKILQVWNSAEEVYFDGLPSQFAVKSNCQSDGRYIVPIADKRDHDLVSLRQEIADYWFNPHNLLINGFSKVHRTVKPKVFAEEFIGEYSKEPIECKVFCFGGEPKVCYASTDHFCNSKLDISEYPISFYSIDWKYLNVTHGNHRAYKDAPKPKNLNEMLEISRILAADFPFVRVDFIYTETRFYLAEMTFFPCGGGFTEYNPPEFDLYLGELFPIG